MSNRVVILTFLNDFNRAYSLTTVILDQVRAFVSLKYDVELWVQTGANLSQFPNDIDVSLVKQIVPHFTWKEDVINDDEVIKIREFLETSLPKDQSIIITHDALFLSWYLGFAKALHLLTPRSYHRWFHMAHSSVGDFRPPMNDPKIYRYSLPHGNHKVVCLNKHIKNKFVRYYGTTDDKVVVINNIRDVRNFLDFPKSISDFISTNNLLEAEIVQVLPFSTPRASAKGVIETVHVFGQLKKLGYKVRLILANSHSSSNTAKEVDKIKALIKSCGLTDKEAIICSESMSTGYNGLNEKEIRSLFQISNLFVFATLSEAGSLVLLEAAISGCLMVLNSNVAALESYIRNDQAIFCDFSAKEVDYKAVAVTIAHNINRSLSNASKRNVLRNFNIESLAKQWRNAIGMY